MVNAHAASRAEQHRLRPLGFYVPFDTILTDASTDCDHSGSSMYVPPLTRIALRMVYSVLTSAAAAENRIQFWLLHRKRPRLKR
jgi:hypothetical protein